MFNKIMTIVVLVLGASAVSYGTSLTQDIETMRNVLAFPKAHATITVEAVKGIDMAID